MQLSYWMKLWRSTSDQRVVLRSGSAVPYDSLIVATGAGHTYFGHTEWERYVPGLKTIEEATDIRSRILMAFEQAESEPDPERQKRLLTFVIVGAGPTGVEMAAAIGELARFETSSGDILPGVAPVAIHQGRYVARVIQNRLKDKAVEGFSYWDRGNLAVIGRNEAVADIRGFRFSGYFAWLLWLFVHLMYLVGFENRVLVFIQWGIDYFTRNRGARLITGKSKDLSAVRYWEHDE